MPNNTKDQELSIEGESAQGYSRDEAFLIALIDRAPANTSVLLSINTSVLAINTGVLFGVMFAD